MTQFSTCKAVLLGAAVSLLSFDANAQTADFFAPLRLAPPALANLFNDGENEPRTDRPLPEQVARAAEMRVANGGPARAHLLIAFDKPLTVDTTAVLADNGVQLIDKWDGDTWIASVDARAAEFAVRAPSVRGAALIPPQAKLDSAISFEEPFEWQKNDDGRLGFLVLFHKGVSADEAAKALAAISGGLREDLDPQAFPYVRSVTVALDRKQLGAVATLDIVRFIEPEAPPNIDFNRTTTQPLSNVDDVQIAPYGLMGAGITVGIWEAGDTIRATHVDLTPRVTVQPGQTTSQDGHALHVAGTVGGSGANFAAAEGMAPEVSILSWDANSDTAEMAVAAGGGARARVVASNHSYGATVGWIGGAFINNQNLFGNYNGRSIAFDTIVAGDGVTVPATELIVLKSAGNDRGDGPGAVGQPRDCRQTTAAVDSDCVGPVASAKNVITVGAMNGGALIAGFSGFGPTDDGRIKPDIMANGTNVISLGDFGVPPGGGRPTDDIAQTDNNTWVAQGTSMATPAVTGIVALLTEQLADLGVPQFSAAAMKAILIQTARDVAGTGQATVGPDFATGWGIADAQAAADLLRRAGGPGYAEGTLIATGAGGAWEFPFVVPPGQPELHITLAWSDLPGSPTGAGSELVNDLDLRLVSPGGAAQTPWTLNPANPTQAAVRNGGDDATNNVEQVSVLNPDAGTWLARVTAKPGSLALGAQRFAVAGPITPDSGPIAGPKANIMLVLDKSGSMILPAATAGLTKIQAMQNAARAFVDYIDLVGGHNLGVVAFDSAVAPTTPNFGLQPLDVTTAGDAGTLIGNLTPGGMTGIIAGVTEATNQLGGSGATNPDDVVFLFSDGRHNRPTGSDVSVIDGVMTESTRFFSVGFGTDVDSSVMPGVAANHAGVHLEEQGLQAGQLAKLFLVVGGLATDETIIVDPDYPLAPRASATQSILAMKQDHTLTFAAFWNEQNRGKMELQLLGPGKECRILMRPHTGLDIRRGSNHALVRVDLPYRCATRKGKATVMHDGTWRLRVRNIGRTKDVAKVMVLAESSVNLRVKSEARGEKALLTASLTDGDMLLRKGVRIRAHIQPNRPSSGDSEKQDGITSDVPVTGVTVDGPGVTGPMPGFGGFTVAPWKTGNIGFPAIGGSQSVVPPIMGSDDPTGALSDQDDGTDQDTVVDLERLSLSPSLRILLEQRAQLLQLNPEVLAQLRGRFQPVPASTGVELRDDGTGGDAKASDGVFSAMLALPNAGLYQGRVVATQARTEGTLTREAMTSFFSR
jgi:hypothetical protein